MTQRNKAWTIVALLIYVSLFILEVSRQRWSFVIFFPIYAAILMARYLRPPTEVNSTGIHRPLRRRSYILWDTVKTIAAPAPEFHTVRINLINGTTIALHDIPASESATVAANGGKQITPAIPVRVPPRSPTRRTDQDLEADVARRAAALAAERADLERRYPRLQRREPPSAR
jgi:hypothetical protein